ncbi:MAG: SUMF1/EgtB/PvdO family nonheme iron enzyme [Phycisphaerales bacterium]
MRHTQRTRAADANGLTLARSIGRHGVAAAIVALANIAAAQAPPDYGLDFVTVGAAGNRGTLPSERPFAQSPDVPVGSVDREFRITRTEVTTGQWAEFCNAYRPYWTGAVLDHAFAGDLTITNDGTYVTSNPNFPNAASWAMSARYCNWLHNDKRPEQWAFESGAYDTSTFTFNPDHTNNFVFAHSPDARYWIPTLDEMVKAVYYDPNRYGPGVEGYWEYPNARSEPLILGDPPPLGNGMTNAAITSFPGPHNVSVGQYPDTNLPWGLLDTSGGQTEYTSTSFSPLGGIYTLGSTFLLAPGTVPIADTINGFLWQGNILDNAGFRVASVVPAPGVGLIFLFVPVTLSIRSRRKVLQ